MKIMKEAFDKMPEIFSSIEFGKEIRKMGLTTRNMQRDGRKFLSQYAVNETKNGKMWRKKSMTEQNLFSEDENQVEANILEAIRFLKSKGFKVMEPVTEYKEL